MLVSPRVSGDGNTVSNPQPISTPPPKSPLAIWSLICGILTYCCMGPLAGIPAIICGHLALGNIKRAQGTVGGGGMAVAGLILGYSGSIIVTVAIVAALVIPAVTAAKEAARRAKASTEVRQIVLAVQQYENDYGRLPDLGGDGTHDVTVAENNSRLFNILRGIDAGHTGNPRQAVYFSAAQATGKGKPSGGLGADGVLYDPWGNPYLIRIDGNGDGQTDDPYGTSPADKVNKTVIAWSLGKDARPGKDGQGDVRSWADSAH